MRKPEGKLQIMNDLPHLWLVDSQGFFDSHLTSKLDPLADAILFATY
ncbi:MAG: hypothetical protein V7K29_08400 [Nostoc sp.]